MERLLALWRRVPVSVRIGFAVLSGLMTVLGLPSLAEDVAGWATWLSFVGATVSGYVFPLLGLTGFLTFIALQAAEVHARRVHTQSRASRDPAEVQSAPSAPPLAPSAPTPRRAARGVASVRRARDFARRIGQGSRNDTERLNSGTGPGRSRRPRTTPGAIPHSAPAIGLRRERKGGLAPRKMVASLGLLDRRAAYMPSVESPSPDHISASVGWRDADSRALHEHPFDTTLRARGESSCIHHYATAVDLLARAKAP